MDYGRYISRYRAIPLNIDGLKCVERRILCSLFEIAKDRDVKSNKIIGHVIGGMHPHGDTSAYKTLVQLVKNNYAIGQGNWGSISLKEDTFPPAADRYTECKLEPWVRRLAFKYINYTQWELLEYESEPLALPSPLPIGLIGEDFITGISFSRTCIPRYKLSDLAIRLKWLLEKDNIDDKIGPCIKPNIRGCTSKCENDTEFYNILTTGKGKLIIIPNGTIENNQIVIKGRVPNSKFNRLLDATLPDNNKNIKLDVTLLDNCKGYDTEIIVEPKKKKTDLNLLAKEIWENYLVGSIKVSCKFSTLEGNIKTQSIDTILLNNYNHWKQAIINKRWTDFNNTIKTYFEMNIILLVKQLINKYNTYKSVNDIINYYHQDYPTQIEIELDNYDTNTNSWNKIKKQITDDDIKSTISKKTIKQLIEIEIDLNSYLIDIQTAMNELYTIDNDCYNEIVELTK